MTRYYQLLLKNDKKDRCIIAGNEDVIMTHKQACNFKRACEPHSHEDYYYEIVEIKDIENYKILPPYHYKYKVK